MVSGFMACSSGSGFPLRCMAVGRKITAAVPKGVDADTASFLAKSRTTAMRLSLGPGLLQP